VTRRFRSPFGFQIRQLVSGRASAPQIFDQLFRNSRLGGALVRVLRHGSLVDGSIVAPRYLPDGHELPLAPWVKLAVTVRRPPSSHAAARMLACFLMHVERVDPKTGKACGRDLWQGSMARRLGFSLRATVDGTPNGAREVQRYVRLFEAGELMRVTQPPSDNVPDHMKARSKACVVRGRAVNAIWSYNVIAVGTSLPGPVLDVLRRWRGVVVAQPLRLMQAVALAIGECATDAETAAHARAVLALLTRPPPIPI